MPVLYIIIVVGLLMSIAFYYHINFLWASTPSSLTISPELEEIILQRYAEIIHKLEDITLSLDLLKKRIKENKYKKYKSDRSPNKQV